jgi:hypothetical protein
MVRDRLNLTERVERIFTLHRKYKPKQVRWERYGHDDAEAVKREQEHQNYRFTSQRSPVRHRSMIASAG